VSRAAGVKKLADVTGVCDVKNSPGGVEGCRVRREVGTKMCIEIECGDHPAARALAFLSSQSNWELPIRGTEKEEFADDDQALAVRECSKLGIAARNTVAWNLVCVSRLLMD
jgi:hypothetical protein